MRKFPEPIQNCVAAFSRLPGVGPKTALRYVFYLLKQQDHDIKTMARTIHELAENIQICDVCNTYTEFETCEICEDPERNDALLCIVEDARDIATVEATDEYDGRYHVLGGTLNPIDGMTPDRLNVRQLMHRVKDNDALKEVILAISPTSEGDSTMMYLTKQLVPLDVKVTRLAQGLAMGSTIEYADEVTLGNALKDRKRAEN